MWSDTLVPSTIPMPFSSLSSTILGESYGCPFYLRLEELHRFFDEDASHSEVKGERSLKGANCYTSKAGASSR